MSSSRRASRPPHPTPRHLSALATNHRPGRASYAISVASGAKVFTFVLMGDQNAGKSTFLHSFTHHADENFLQMSSLLPVLSVRRPRRKLCPGPGRTWVSALGLFRQHAFSQPR